MDTLQELLLEELKDLYSAEKQLTKALPKMAKRASSEALKDAFTTHLEQTKGHIERLEKIGAKLGKKLTGKVCAAMEGLVEEGKEILEEDGEGPVIDAALIGAGQRIEHYEMAGYGTVRAIAEALGEDELVELLQETLDEEGEADKLLTEIATGEVLPEASKAGEEEEGEEEEEEEEDADAGEEEAEEPKKKVAAKSKK